MPPRRRNPYPALIVVALIPAAALGGIWRAADSLQPAEVNVPLDSGAPAVTPGVMTTRLLSVRRAPAVLSVASNEAALVEALPQLIDTIDDTSCVDIAVNGTHIDGKNETTSLRPASTVKLLVAAVALEVLGPDFVYTTTVQGEVGDNGVVAGNLYLVGGGDPVLSSTWWNGPNPNYPPFNVTQIERLADAVVAAGVRAVQGEVVGDASRYDDEWYSPTWTDDLKFVEGGPISGLLVNDSRESLSVAANDPAQGAARVFAALLKERGVFINEGGSAGASASTTTIAEVQSNPLPLILAEMLTTSDNNTAEMILKELGLATSGAGTRLDGLAVVETTLKDWGVPMDGVTLVDGSGLSDDNRLTCAALMAVLQHGSVTDYVGQGLAIGGKPGGTLADAFAEGQPLSGIIRAKTGTLYNYQDGVGGKPGAKTLAGYIPLEGGEVEFVLMLNGPQIAEQANYRPIWDLFATILGDYASAPSASDLAPR